MRVRKEYLLIFAGPEKHTNPISSRIYKYNIWTNERFEKNNYQNVGNDSAINDSLPYDTPDGIVIAKICTYYNKKGWVFEQVIQKNTDNGRWESTTWEILFSREISRGERL